MRVYLDDCSDDDDLIAALERSGHTVFSPRSEGLRGADDPDHLEHAQQIGCILMTRNPGDFERLHFDYQAAGRTHLGIFLVYGERIRSKEPTIRELVAAIQKLEQSGVPIANFTHN